MLIMGVVEVLLNGEEIIFSGTPQEIERQKREAFNTNSAYRDSVDRRVNNDPLLDYVRRNASSSSSLSEIFYNYFGQNKIGSPRLPDSDFECTLLLERAGSIYFRLRSDITLF